MVKKILTKHNSSSTSIHIHVISVSFLVVDLQHTAPPLSRLHVKERARKKLP
jgi:hypothetical protein